MRDPTAIAGRNGRTKGDAGRTKGGRTKGDANVTSIVLKRWMSRFQRPFGRPHKRWNLNWGYVSRSTRPRELHGHNGHLRAQLVPKELTGHMCPMDPNSRKKTTAAPPTSTSGLASILPPAASRGTFRRDGPRRIASDISLLTENVASVALSLYSMRLQPNRQHQRRLPGMRDAGRGEGGGEGVRRKLFNFAAVACLVLCFATITLWVRGSFYREDEWIFCQRADEGKRYVYYHGDVRSGFAIFDAELTIVTTSDAELANYFGLENAEFGHVIWTSHEMGEYSYVGFFQRIPALFPPW